MILFRGKLAGIMEESLINEIRNYTTTGYQSDAFKYLLDNTEFSLEMFRDEVIDWEYV